MIVPADGSTVVDVIPQRTYVLLWLRPTYGATAVLANCFPSSTVRTFLNKASLVKGFSRSAT